MLHRTITCEVSTSMHCSMFFKGFLFNIFLQSLLHPAPAAAEVAEQASVIDMGFLYPAPCKLGHV